MAMTPIVAMTPLLLWPLAVAGLAVVGWLVVWWWEGRSEDDPEPDAWWEDDA